MEVDPWDQSVLVDDVLELAVSEKDELLRSCINLLGHVGLLGRIRSLGAGLTLAQDLSQLLDAVGLLNLSDNAVALLDKVADDLLQETHAGVLASVSEVVQVVLELLGGGVGHANVDQTRLKVNKFWSVRISFNFSERLTMILSIIALFPLILRFCRAKLRIWMADSQLPSARNCSDYFKAVSGVTY